MCTVVSISSTERCMNIMCWKVVIYLYVSCIMPLRYCQTPTLNEEANKQYTKKQQNNIMDTFIKINLECIPYCNDQISGDSR